MFHMWPFVISSFHLECFQIHSNCINNNISLLCWQANFYGFNAIHLAYIFVSL